MGLVDFIVDLTKGSTAVSIEALDTFDDTRGKAFFVYTLRKIMAQHPSLPKPRQERLLKLLSAAVEEVQKDLAEGG